MTASTDNAPQLIKHISFDLDGTLTYVSEDYPAKIISAVFNRLNLGTATASHIEAIWLGSDKDQYIQDRLHQEVSTFWQTFDLFDTPLLRSENTFLFPGVAETLRTLKNRGYKLSLLSGALSWHMKMLCERVGENLFDQVLAISYSSFPNKPDPLAFFHIAEQLEVSSKQSVYVGNSEEDLLMAHNAGCQFIYANTQNSPLVLHDNDLEIKNISDLLDLHLR